MAFLNITHAPYIIPFPLKFNPGRHNEVNRLITIIFQQFAIAITRMNYKKRIMDNPIFIYILLPVSYIKTIINSINRKV